MAMIRGLKLQEKGLLYRQLAYLIASGATPKEAIAILHAESGKGKIRFVLESILSNLNQGASVADSLGSQPRYFNETLVYVITSNHDHDKIAAFLFDYADEVEHSADIRLSLFQTMIYPVKIMIIAILIMTMLMIFVIPVFDDIFTGMHQELPNPTRIVVQLSSAMSGYVIFLMVAIVGGLILLMRSKRLVYRIGRWLPGIKTLISDLSVYTFSKFLGLLLQLDRPLPECMRYAAHIVPNRSFGEKIIAISNQITNTTQFKEQAQTHRLLPSIFFRTLAVGQRTLSLDQSLAELARYYHRRIAKQIEIYHNILELAAIIFVGLLVGIIVISLYLPLFQLAGGIT